MLQQAHQEQKVIKQLTLSLELEIIAHQLRRQEQEVIKQSTLGLELEVIILQLVSLEQGIR